MISKSNFSFSCQVGEQMQLGSLSNHDERDDDVKYVQRGWDENVIFVSKMNLKQRGCSRTTRLKNFVQIHTVSSVDIAYSSQ